MIRIKLANQEIGEGITGVEAIYYTDDWMEEEFKNSLIEIDELPTIPFSEEFDYNYGYFNEEIVLVSMKKPITQDQEIEQLIKDNLTTLEALVEAYELLKQENLELKLAIAALAERSV